MSGKYWGRGFSRPSKRWEDPLSRMDPLKFERLIADYYRRQGYRVVECGTGATRSRFDGGIDLKLYRDDEYIVVQCKRYTHSVVKHNDLHQLLGVMLTEGATRAIFINSGEYSRHALQQLRGIPNFEIVDGTQLREMLGSVDAIADVGSTDIRIEPTFGPKFTAAKSDHWTDYSDTIPNARPRTNSDHHAEARRNPRDNAVRLWLIFAAGILLVSCIRHFSSQANRLVPTKIHHLVEAAPDEHALGPAPSLDSTRPLTKLAVPRRQPTKAEIREQQRKAEEAMKVIKDSTPEL